PVRLLGPADEEKVLAAGDALVAVLVVQAHGQEADDARVGLVVPLGHRMPLPRSPSRSGPAAASSTIRSPGAGGQRGNGRAPGWYVSGGRRSRRRARCGRAGGG